MGSAASKCGGGVEEGDNYGFDNDQQYYNHVEGDHLAYRYKAPLRVGDRDGGRDGIRVIMRTVPVCSVPIL